MTDTVIKITRVPVPRVVIQADPSFSTRQAIEAAEAAAISAGEAAADAVSADASADAAAVSETNASNSAIAAAASAVAADGSADDAAASAAAASATLASSLKIDQNLADLDDAATARTNLGVPPSTRAVNAGTGLTGGGDLSADRTISASIASQAQAEAGTATTVLMTPQRTRQALNATGTAPVYACRAWVNFNGQGTVAIRASGNVTSITDNGTGDYTVNFVTALPDTNYAVNATGQLDDTGGVGYSAIGIQRGASSMLTTSVRLNAGTIASASAAFDYKVICVSVFR